MVNSAPTNVTDLGNGFVSYTLGDTGQTMQTWKDTFVGIYGDSWFQNNDDVGSAFDVEPEPSVADYFSQNPGLSAIHFI